MLFIEKIHKKFIQKAPPTISVDGVLLHWLQASLLTYLECKEPPIIFTPANTDHYIPIANVRLPTSITQPTLTFRSTSTDTYRTGRNFSTTANP